MNMEETSVDSIFGAGDEEGRNQNGLSVAVKEGIIGKAIYGNE